MEKYEKKFYKKKEDCLHYVEPGPELEWGIRLLNVRDREVAIKILEWLLENDVEIYIPKNPTEDDMTYGYVYHATTEERGFIGKAVSGALEKHLPQVGEFLNNAHEKLIEMEKASQFVSVDKSYVEKTIERLKAGKRY